MLIGHEGVATALTLRLRERAGETARIVEQLQNLPPNSITVPGADDIHPVWTNVVAKGRFPTWMVLCRDSPLRRTVGEGSVGATSDEVNWRYPFTIATHVSSTDERATALLRYRLMLVVRVILLQDRILVKGDTGKAEIRTEDMNEVMSGEAYRESKYLMEGLTEFHVRSVESIPTIRPPYGQAGTIGHTQSPLQG